MAEGRAGWRVGLVVAVGLAAGVVGALALRPPTVELVAVEVREIRRTLVVVGQVRAPGRAALGVAIPGVVREVRAEAGDRVEAGALLLLLEDREARAAVAEAEAALVEIEATARSERERAEAALLLAERELDRIRAVHAEGGLTLQRVEEAEQRALEARSRAEVARAATGPGRPPAAIERVQAALEGARARLESSRVTAPAAGVVLRRLVEPGDAAQPGRVLLELALEGPPEIVAFPAEENLPVLRVGAPARVSADAFPADTFSARIHTIAPLVDPDRGTVEVRFAIPDPPAYLRPDMTLSVSVEGEVRPDARVLPLGAVQGLGLDDPWVGIVREGRLERHAIRVGLRGEGFVEVLAGVEPGDRVAVGSDLPEPGTRVRVGN